MITNIKQETETKLPPKTEEDGVSEKKKDEEASFYKPCNITDFLQYNAQIPF